MELALSSVPGVVAGGFSEHDFIFISPRARTAQTNTFTTARSAFPSAARCCAVL